MPHCPNCGAEVDSDASFCSSCGENIEASIEDDQVESTVSDSEEGESLDTTVSAVGMDATDGIEWGNVAIALFLGLVPAFVGYVIVSIAAGASPITYAFWLGIPVFGYLIYRRPNRKAMLGGMYFWLSVESFLTPVFFLIYVFVRASQTGMAETDIGAASTAIGGVLIAGGAFVVGVPLGIALYLVSRRLDPD